MTATKHPTQQVARVTTASFTDMVNEAMDEKGISIRELAKLLQVTYETARVIRNGQHNGISKPVLQDLAAILGLDYATVYTAYVAWEIEKRYGDIPAQLAGKNTELMPIERVWDKLTPEQKRNAIAMIQSWANLNA